jgi:Resolvase, N terminal domain
LNTLAAITGKGAGFRSLHDTWADTTTAHGRLMLTVLGGLAEFERELIRTRTGEGRERAKANGVKMGRKPKLTGHQKREAIKRRDRDAETLAEIGRSYVRLDDRTACAMTNKVVGICPCCFREIAVQRGLMVHHGYERHTGYHTSSCEAAFRFKPLEVSGEGLQWLLVVAENSQYRDKKRLGNKAGWPLIYEGEVPKVTMIARGDPG